MYTRHNGVYGLCADLRKLKNHAYLGQLPCCTDWNVRLLHSKLLDVSRASAPTHPKYVKALPRELTPP
jgi:hypothetical protein